MNGVSFSYRQTAQRLEITPSTYEFEEMAISDGDVVVKPLWFKVVRNSSFNNLQQRVVVKHLQEYPMCAR